MRTINIAIESTTQAGAGEKITFYPYAFSIDGTKFAGTVPVVVQLSAKGTGVVTLLAGNYNVVVEYGRHFSKRDVFVITVPNDDATCNLTDLYSEGLTVIPPTPSFLLAALFQSLSLTDNEGNFYFGPQGSANVRYNLTTGSFERLVSGSWSSGHIIPFLNTPTS